MLEIARGDVVETDVAGDGLERVLDRNLARVAADDDTELRLVVDPLGDRRDDDRLPGPINVFGHFAKSSGRSGRSTPCSSA